MTESNLRLKSKVDVVGSSRKESRRSNGSFVTDGLEAQMILLDGDSANDAKKIKEHESEGDSLCDGSMIDGGNKDGGGITIKQLKAQEKLSCYQKGWQRMNNILNRPVGKGSRNCSLIDKQNNYVSPRDDCLSSFYESTMRSVTNCPNERKRSVMLEQAV